MKLFRILPVFFLLVATLASAQSTGNQYVVIGAFRVLDNAVRYTEKANKMNFHAQYALNKTNNLYYVFLLQTTEARQAIAFMMKMRLETEFKEAWVYRGVLGIELTEEQPVAKVEIKPEPKKEEPKKEEPKTEPIVIKEEPKQDPPKVETQPVVETPKETVVETKPAVDSTAIKANLEPKPPGKPFIFKLMNGETNEPVVGEVHVAEGGATTYQSFPVNEVVYLIAPKNPSQIYQVTTLSAGYQEMNRVINFADPAESASEVGSNAEFIIALPLVRVKMGDYIEFSNVRFFQNSAILQPESKDELDGLALLLRENPKYKVNIHGHCNGTQDRNIILRGENADFFTPNTSSQRKTVTAKEFTELRAGIVRDYLVTQGVEAGRIKIKGEGGKALIYPVNSTLSARNDCVEVEVKKGR